MLRDGNFGRDQTSRSSVDFTEASPNPERRLSERNGVPPKVAILLCTYHGQRYLAEQLDSLAAQTHPNWEVWVSDDGSKDATQVILETYRSRWGGRLSVQRGPAEGFVANFLSLICTPSIKADFYAYSDQDDIWEPEKLQRALMWLGDVAPDVPALYCSRTRLVDARGNHLGYSPQFTRPPGFANALVQNVGGGNTMVFNAAACALLREAGKDIDVVTHDWWTYIVVSGCGGKVFYDATPSLRYRQHGANLVGGRHGWQTWGGRLRMVFKGRFRSWVDRNIEALQVLRHRLTPANRQTLDRFTAARRSWLLPRLLGVKRAGIYRQTLLDNLALFAAVVLKKI